MNAWRNENLDLPLTAVCQYLLNITRFVQKIIISGLEFRNRETLEYLKHIRQLTPLKLSFFQLLLTYLFTLPTACRRILLNKLTNSQLLKNFSVFYGNRKFISAFTSVPILSQINPIRTHPILEDPILNITLPSTSGLFKWFLSFMLPHQNPV
jgi:hypothetical protein